MRYRCMYFSCALTLESHFIHGRDELECRHKKKNCSDIGEMRKETVKREYARRSLRLGEGRSCMFWQVNDSRSSTVNRTAIIKVDDGKMSQRVSSFVLKFADILFRFTNHRAR